MESKIISKPIAAGFGISLAVAIASCMLNENTLFAFNHQSPKRVLCAVAGSVLGSYLQYAYENRKNLNALSKFTAFATLPIVGYISALSSSEHPQNTHILLLAMAGSFAGPQTPAWVKAAYQNYKKRPSPTKPTDAKAYPIAKGATAAGITGVFYYHTMSALSALGGPSYKTALFTSMVSVLVSAGYGICVKGKKLNPKATPTL